MQIGLLVGMALTLVAFEWTTYTTTTRGLGDVNPIETWDPEPIQVVQTPPSSEARPEQPKAPTNFNLIPVVDPTDPIEPENQGPEVDPYEKWAEMIGLEEEGDPWDTTTGAPMSPLPPQPIVEEMPYMCDCESYPTKEERKACTDNLIMEHLRNTVEVPEIVLDAQATQTAYVYWVVNEDGSIGNVEVKNEGRVYPAVSEEAMRAVNTMPCWIPGKQRLRPVKVCFTMPIKFVAR